MLRQERWNLIFFSTNGFQLYQSLYPEGQVMQQDQKSQPIDDHTQELSKQMPKPELLVFSQFFDQYKQGMEVHCPRLQTLQKEHLQELEKNQIKFNRNRFQPKLKLKVKYASISKEVMVLGARWGHFQLSINVLNVLGGSATHSLHFYPASPNSTIYKINFLQKKFIIKCVPIMKKHSREWAIKEWFLLRIASALKVGPHVEPYIGFDLIMHQKCVEFAMEICSKVHKQTLDTDWLLVNLGVLHKFHIVHADIKPQNIMMSETYGKIVFIDFGLSKTIQQQPGMKAISSFVGSLTYCSEQMTKCFNSGVEMAVDLYYNDLFCLQKTIKFLSTSNLGYSQKYHQNILQNYESKESQILLEYMVKFMLFSSEKNDSLEILSHINQKSIKEVLVFLKEIPQNKKTRHFFFNLVPQAERETIIYNQIKYIYQSANEYSSYFSFKPDLQKYELFSSFYTPLDQQVDTQKWFLKRIQAIKQLVFSKQLIAKAQFHQYVRSYLDFISYFNNKCKVTKEQRVQAAKVYSEMFLKEAEQSSQPLKGYKFIGKTIEDILFKFLYGDVKNKLCDETLMTIFFKLYDFLSILDCGTVSQFFKWLTDIASLQKINTVFRTLFVLKVKSSLNFHYKRTQKRNGESRVNFQEQLQLWVNLFTTQKAHFFQYDYFKHEQIQKAIEKKASEFNINQLSQILNECEIPFTHLTNKLQGQFSQKICQEIEQMYIAIKQKNGHQKISLFLVSLFNFYIQLGNSQLSRGIYHIFNKNIADPQILQEFSFQLQLNTIQFLINPLNNSGQSEKGFKYLSSYISKVQEPCLKQNLSLLVKLFNKIILKNAKSIDQFDYSFPFLFRPIFSELVQKLPKALLYQLTLSSTKAHICLDPHLLFDCLGMSRVVLYQKQEEIYLLLSNVLESRKIQCKKCEIFVKADLIHYLMQNTIFQITIENRKKDLVAVGNSSKIILSKLQQLVSLVNSQECERTVTKQIRLSLQQNGLYFLVLVCSLQNAFQEQHHGIYLYFDFCLRNNCFHFYFLHSNNHRTYFLKTCQILQKYHPQSFLVFLCKITQTIQAKPFSRNIQTILKLYNDYLKYIGHPQQILVEHFLSLKCYENSLQNNRYSNIILIYSVLLFFVQSQKIKFKIINEILKKVEHSKGSFKWMLRSMLYQFNLAKFDPKSDNRKMQFMSKKISINRINMMGLLPKKKRKCSQAKAQFIYNKLSKITQGQLQPYKIKVKIKHK